MTNPTNSSPPQTLPFTEPGPLPEPPKTPVWKSKPVIVTGVGLAALLVIGLAGAPRTVATAETEPSAASTTVTDEADSGEDTPSTPGPTSVEALRQSAITAGLKLTDCSTDDNAPTDVVEHLECRGPARSVVFLTTYSSASQAKSEAEDHTTDKYMQPKDGLSAAYGSLKPSGGWMIFTSSDAINQSVVKAMGGKLLEPPSDDSSDDEASLSTEQQQAVDKGQSYLDNVGGFSRRGLVKQLKYEGFSTKQSNFAVDYLKPDFKKQAAIKAQSYLDNVGGFSKASLRRQLAYQGFTSAQINYAIKMAF